MQTQAAMILPPKEGFAPGHTGAIGLLLARLAAVPGPMRQIVLGMGEGGFAGVGYKQVRPAWVPAKLAWRYAVALRRALTELRPDIVEVHNRPDIALYLAARIKAPVVLVLHNDPQAMRSARTATQRKAILAGLARVAAVSDWVRGRMLDGVAGRCDVLANSLDLTAVPPSPAERERVILFAGRVVADKGVDGFVAACALALPQLPGWRAEVIGADRFGPDSPMTPFLAGLIPRARAAGVTLAGYRPHDAVLAAMARAAIVAVPSRWPEPFGLTALEAMAAGAALLVTPRGGLAEVAGGVGVDVDPDDPAGMAAAMVALAQDPARRAALGAAGRARAACFGLAEGAAALAALRADVLGAWPRAPGHPI